MKDFDAADSLTTIFALFLIAMGFFIAGYEYQVFVVLYAACFLVLGAIALLFALGVLAIAFVVVFNVCTFAWNLFDRKHYHNYINL